MRKGVIWPLTCEAVVMLISATTVSSNTTVMFSSFTSWHEVGLGGRGEGGASLDCHTTCRYTQKHAHTCRLWINTMQVKTQIQHRFDLRLTHTLSLHFRIKRLLILFNVHLYNIICFILEFTLYFTYICQKPSNVNYINKVFILLHLNFHIFYSYWPIGIIKDPKDLFYKL